MSRGCADGPIGRPLPGAFLGQTVSNTCCGSDGSRHEDMCKVNGDAKSESMGDRVDTVTAELNIMTGMGKNHVAAMQVYVSSIPNDDARKSQMSLTPSTAITMGTLVGSDVYGWEEEFDRKDGVVTGGGVGSVAQSGRNEGPGLCPVTSWRRKGLLYKVFDAARRRIDGRSERNS